jgi:hypothetical protein
VWRETVDVLRSVQWPGLLVLQHAAVVVTVLALVLALLMTVDAASHLVLETFR